MTIKRRKIVLIGPTNKFVIAQARESVAALNRGINKLVSYLPSTQRLNFTTGNVISTDNSPL